MFTGYLELWQVETVAMLALHLSAGAAAFTGWNAFVTQRFSNTLVTLELGHQAILNYENARVSYCKLATWATLIKAEVLDPSHPRGTLSQAELERVEFFISNSDERVIEAVANVKSVERLGTNGKRKDVVATRQIHNNSERFLNQANGHTELFTDEFR